MYLYIVTTFVIFFYENGNIYFFHQLSSTDFVSFEYKLSLMHFELEFSNIKNNLACGLIFCCYSQLKTGKIVLIYIFLIYRKTKLYRDEMNYFKVTDDDSNYDYDAYNRNMDEYFDDGHHTIITVRFVK